MVEYINRNSRIVTRNISLTKITSKDAPKFRTKKRQQGQRIRKKRQKALHGERKPVMLRKD